MLILSYLANLFGGHGANFFAGALLCNGVPHLVSGLQGMSFPTPFARPRGVGNSPALVNVLWGFINLSAGGYLLAHHPIAFELDAGSLLTALGALVMGVYLAMHFAKVMQGRRAA